MRSDAETTQDLEDSCPFAAHLEHFELWGCWLASSQQHYKGRDESWV